MFVPNKVWTYSSCVARFSDAPRDCDREVHTFLFFRSRWGWSDRECTKPSIFYDHERKRNSAATHRQPDKSATARATPLGGLARHADRLQTRQRVQTAAQLLHYHRHADAYLLRLELWLFFGAISSLQTHQKCIVSAYVLYSVGIQHRNEYNFIKL